jgi:hypothetical protein
MKKIIGFIVLAISLISCASLANVKTSGKFRYKILENGTIAITRYFGNDINVIIPDNIDGLIVTEIESLIHDEVDSFLGSSDRYDENYTIEIITIPETVVKVGHDAFEDCEKLIKVVIMDNNVNSLGKLSIFDDGVFNYIRPNIEILPERNLVEKIFEKNDAILTLQSDVGFSEMPHYLSFSTNLLYNGNIIYGPVNHNLYLQGGPVSHDFKDDIQIIENGNDDVYIFIKYRKSYSDYYTIFVNNTILTSDVEIEEIKKVNGNIFFIENKNCFKSLYKNNTKIFDGLPKLRQVIIDDNGVNIAYITQDNNNTYVLYLNRNEYFRTNPQIRSTIDRVKFSPNGQKLVFIERFATTEGNLYYININKRSIGPYRYIDAESFSIDSKYFQYKYNNNQGWVEEKIEL